MSTARAQILRTSSSISRVAERRRPGDLPGRLRVLEHRQPRGLRTRQRTQVARIGADHDVERRDHVGKSTSHRAFRREVLPVGWRHPLRSGLSRGRASRPRARSTKTGYGSNHLRPNRLRAAPCRQRGQPRSRPKTHRACGRGSTGLRGRPENGIVGVRLPTELGGVGLADDDAPRRNQPGDEGRIRTLRRVVRRRPSSRGWSRSRQRPPDP